MYLLFDVGNTHTVLGTCTNNEYKTWRIGSKSFDSEDELFSKIYNLLSYAKIDFNEIKKIGVSSVVPSVNFMIEKMGEKYLNIKTEFVNVNKRIFDIDYKADYPSEIGADRLSNVIAAKKEYGDNVIAIDFGTAITLDVIYNGDFEGGAIIPGFRTSMLSLFSNTAQLPQVELNIPTYNIGKNTKDNIQIGILKNTVYGIERLIDEIKKEKNTDFKVITTGGMAKYLVDIFKDYDPYLTLKGILYFIEN